MADSVAEGISMMGLVGAIVFSIYVISNNRRRQNIAKTQTELQSKILDKLTSSQEMAEFLRTPSGQRLLEGPRPEVETPNAQARILRSVQVGLISSLLGGALVLLGFFDDRVHHEMNVLGIMAFAVGLGFLLSSAVSYALSKSWGLFDRNGNGRS